MKLRIVNDDEQIVEAMDGSLLPCEEPLQRIPPDLQTPEAASIVGHLWREVAHAAGQAMQALYPEDVAAVAAEVESVEVAKFVTEHVLRRTIQLRSLAKEHT